MTKVLIASDSFKGSASSSQVAEYIAKGIKKVDATIDIKKIPIADGGEGTIESLLSACHGKSYTKKVVGALGNEINATWGMMNDNEAVIEVAEAAGFIVDKSKVSPMKTTTYGVGQLIEEALNHDVKTIYIGLGGSSTTDGGVGLAQALGVHFYDDNGQEVGLGGQELIKIKDIDISNIDGRLSKCQIIGLSDVTNPLTGEEGSAYVFSPQKGATSDEVEQLELGLQNLRRVSKKVLGKEYGDTPGAGAAGGIGFALLTLLGGQLESGIQKIMRLINLEEEIKRADLVITGEGQMDGQSIKGKAPIGIAKLAKKHKLPVIAITGSIGNSIEKVYENGVDLVISSTSSPMTLEEAVKNSDKLLDLAGMTAIKAYNLRN
ncbi:glycerate kinase [Ligilactobacillus salivarius]|uniref:glycerate kinase family protein n=1 Tax=Ligilactobacillus salivarius TaxID=1624 RepID=UPI0011CA427A|nr:glycerate kinase [Ligilactobacillus salivarius]TXJ77556.1 glycerate kinase [Ligilactobacillus salivarius]